MRFCNFNAITIRKYESNNSKKSFHRKTFREHFILELFFACEIVKFTGKITAQCSLIESINSPPHCRKKYTPYFCNLAIKFN